MLVVRDKEFRMSKCQVWLRAQQGPYYTTWWRCSTLLEPSLHLSPIPPPVLCLPIPRASNPAESKLQEWKAQIVPYSEEWGEAALCFSCWGCSTTCSMHLKEPPFPNPAHPGLLRGLFTCICNRSFQLQEFGQDCPIAMSGGQRG